ncbi:MAG: efflux RND transporter periplasmic adaptor subunit [Deltaproteobacteria bacterium]|jgi:HlyD family secretion protein|nr:efflux RND transporter periplasmic adaptor subunit [Deltaproteobacteria bacterium]MBT4527082.1 efflux RND transporter periplasmic adaptor subunit [Deltaproteobacteria bacterium]
MTNKYQLKHIILGFILVSFSGMLFGQTQGISVKVMELVPQKLVVKKEYIGHLEPLERVTIKSETAGTVEAVFFDEGKVVNKGEVLVHISTEKLTLDVDIAKANYRLANTNYQTEKMLLDKKMADKRLQISESQALEDLAIAESDYLAEKQLVDKDITFKRLQMEKRNANSAFQLAELNYQTQKMLADQDISLQKAKLNLNQAQANYNLAKSNCDKEKGLLDKQLSSQSNFDIVANTLENRRIALVLANIELERVKVQTDQIQLESFLNQRDAAKINLELVELDLENYTVKNDNWKLKSYKTVWENARLKLAQIRIDLEESASKSNQVKLESFRNARDVNKVQLDLALLNLEKSKIKAPFTGVVKRKYAQNGGYLKLGENLLEIMDISSVLAKINIPEKDIQYLKRGKIVKITLDALPDQILKGSIKTIGLEADIKSRSFPAEVIVDNSDRNLLPGMMTRAETIALSLSKQIMIPSHAVLEREYGKVVFIVENGKAVEKNVSLGTSVENKVQVLSGLDVGDRLVVSSQQFIANNDIINIIATSKQLVQR